MTNVKRSPNDLRVINIRAKRWARRYPHTPLPPRPEARGISIFFGVPRALPWATNRSPLRGFWHQHVRAHGARRVLKRQTSQVKNTRTAGHAQPKRMAIERVSLLTCDGSLPPWQVKAQATFSAQPVATAIAAAPRPFKRERDLSSQKSTTGSRRAVSNRAVVANFCMMRLNV